MPESNDDQNVIWDHGRLMHVTSALKACRDLVEISPYECFCGVFDKAIPCEYHARLDKLLKALELVGFAPSWYDKVEKFDPKRLGDD